MPATKDDAIIAQGVLAVFLLDVFRPFGGLTPVELLLRIGQHNSVTEAILFTALEYLSDSDAQKEFTILEPKDGKTYLPGDIRIAVSAKSSNIAFAIVTVSDAYQTSFDITLEPNETGSVYYGYARCEEIGNYTFAFSVTFNDDAKTTKTANVGIKIDTAANTPDAANPEGEDLTAFDANLLVLDTYYREATKEASGSTPISTATIEKAYGMAKVLARLAYELTAKKIITVPINLITAVNDAAEVLKQ
jgi:hypothetical protein